MTKSSFEEMLEALQRRETKPKDLIPGLPSRPTIRSRLPSQKRPLPINFEVEETEEEKTLKRYEEMVLRSKIFGKRNVKLQQPEESPYVKMENIMNYKGRWEHVNKLELGNFEEKFRWADIMDTVVKKKLLVWCRLPDVRWELGSIKAVKEKDVDILLSDGKVLTASIENLLPANPEILDDVEDLVQLAYLNEPSVLHSLKCRYSRDMIYTTAGNLLVAINPFGEVPLYGNDFVAAYKEKNSSRPHVYAVADSAFSKMIRDGANQSIFISGESGSGKTETSKIAMQYFSTLGGSSGIEHKVLLINPILEAFGNAKTARNDNSSRFGKLIEIQFNMSGKICGAKIQTFLLEKSRIVRRAKGERSYHVFYQLCAGAPALLKEKLNVKAANEYEYLKQSDCLRINEIDDAQRFNELMEALNNFQISKKNQEDAFAMIAAVLWLGNIEFLVIDNEDHVEVVPNEGLTSAAKLMGCKVTELMLALSTRGTQAGSEEIVQKLTLSEAIDFRDVLARSIYDSLFDWLVEQLNKSLEAEKLFTGKFISILDIYGFESFRKNHFEQLCINYANEKLQQHFNGHLFKLEQEEYIQDGIDWNYVDFTDNTDCLNLFEKYLFGHPVFSFARLTKNLITIEEKPLGLLSLLDEESTSPRATDLTLEYKLKQHLNRNPCFNCERDGSFQVNHNAGEVLYETHGFLEKNRDLLPSDCIKLLLSCDCQLLQSFASHMLNQSQNAVGSIRQLSNADSHGQSIATKFKDQLFNLMQHLENTTPHFIQCIIPNNNKLPGVYEDDLVLRQLRCSGILEIVKISRSGYPTRMTHQQFAERYGFLLLKNVASEDPLSVAVGVLQKFNILPEMYQVGYTKLFFRRGQIVALENIRNHAMKRILWVQKSLRSLQDRRSFLEIKKGATTLQSFIRGSLVRKNFIINTGLKRHHKTYSLVLVQNLQPQASEPTQLEMPVLKAEAALRQKEEENVTLRKQLQEYEIKCSDTEAKMKSMQESWQKHMTSLQMNRPPVMKNYQPGNLGYESTDTMSPEARSPEQTPRSGPRISNAGPARNFDNTQNHVGPLVREFEQRKQAFEDDARVLGSSTNPTEDLWKLKARFRKWNKDYRAQLKNAKSKIRKLVVSNVEKPRRKWWKLRRPRS